MKRRAFLSGLAAAAAACRPGPRLNVWNWPAYVAPETIPDFEREAGVSVRYGTYESNEEMLAKVMTGNSGWDVVFPSHYLIRPMRESGLLAAIDRGMLKNLENLEPRFQAPEWDPHLERCVPYLWGATGIVYNRRLEPAPAKWADLWRPEWQGRITMLDDPAEVLGACLKKLGFSLNSTDPVQLAAARQEAIRQKPLLRGYLNTEVRDQLVSGDVAAAQMWATTAQQALDASPELRFVYPEEGFGVYVDNAVILRESRRRPLAHRFIDHLLRAPVAARVAATCRTATANRAARALLPASLRDDPVLYPPPETLQRGEPFAPLPPAAQRLRDRIWTEIKSA